MNTTADAIRRVCTAQTTLPTPLGAVLLVRTAQGLAGAWFAEQKHHPGDFAAPQRIEHRHSNELVVVKRREELAAAIVDLVQQRRHVPQGIGRPPLHIEVARAQSQLAILEPVGVSLVVAHPLVMSVETLGTRSGPFVIRVDEAFVQTLSFEEAEAALAHELGHVWIYTHHPYLQTERLANDIALRVVSRSALEPLYAKVWMRTGIKGNLAEYISDGQ